MATFEKSGVVSLWVGRELPDPSVDILKELCGADYYDIDFQEVSGNEDWSLTSIESLVRNLSYSNSYLQAALVAASSLGIRDGRWALLQLDYCYDPKLITRHISPDPVFLGCFDWHE